MAAWDDEAGKREGHGRGPVCPTGTVWSYVLGNMVP